MLVIISDLHLLDDKDVRSSIRSRAFKVFSERLSDSVYDASWRDQETYKPIDEVNIVLLGDIFDLIRSSKWPLRVRNTKTRDITQVIRPWDPPNTAQFADTVEQITDGILSTNSEGLDVLKKLGTNGIDIPKGENGKKSETDRIMIPVKIYYMIGNHDWFYHLPGNAYNVIRKKIIKELALAHSNDDPFPYFQKEDNNLNNILNDHKVYLHHGDIYDDLNFDGNRNKSSFGDAVVIELVNSFHDAVNQNLKPILPVPFIEGLHEIDNVRPLDMIPRWVESLVKEFGLSQQQESSVKQEWDFLVKQFLGVSFVRRSKSKKAKKVKSAFKWSRRFNFGRLVWLKKHFGWLFGGRDREFPNFENALHETEIRSGRSKFVVYGHTHRPIINILDNRTVGNNLLHQSQYYFNSGTWRQVHRLAKRETSEFKFGGYKMMTYVMIFKENEHKGQKFGIWTGMLDSS